MIFQYINVCPVPREMLKTSAYGLGFQHLPRDLANVNAWKTMFDPYNRNQIFSNKEIFLMSFNSGFFFGDCIIEQIDLLSSQYL